MIKLIKTVHTFTWLIMTSAVFYTLFCGITGKFNNLLWFAIGLIILEGTILLFNKGNCPLTNLAKKYTRNKSYNFDIYIPNWLAKINKTTFGTLFLIGLILIFLRIIL